MAWKREEMVSRVFMVLGTTGFVLGAVPIKQESGSNTTDTLVQFMNLPQPHSRFPHHSQRSANRAGRDRSWPLLPPPPVITKSQASPLRHMAACDLPDSLSRAASRVIEEDSLFGTYNHRVSLRHGEAHSEEGEDLAK